MIEVRPIEPAEAVRAFEVCRPMLRRGRDIPEVIAGAACFAVAIEGRPVFTWAVRRIGSELWIDAAAGEPCGVDLTRAGFEVIESQAAGLETVAFQTTRRGLVKKAQALGYEIDGYILRKRLND